MEQVFRLGHVLTICTSDNSGNASVNTRVNEISFNDVNDSDAGLHGEKYALPLFRGYTDSVARGDLIMYTTIGNHNWYMGPINTTNMPNFPVDPTHSPKRKYNRSTDNPQTGYNLAMEMRGISRLNKYPNPFLDHVGNPTMIPIDSPQYLESSFNDLIFEGRHGNSIRLGSRGMAPQLIIWNQGLNSHTSETIEIGSSIIGMTSIGRIEDTFKENAGYRLSIDKSNEEEDIRLNFGHDVQSEKTFNYEYNRKSIDPEAEFPSKPSSQIIISSDRIIFDSMVEDVTISSNRNINIGANKNISISNKGFSVFQSQNIYIGQGAKLRTQPMVLGENLRHLLAKILRLIADSYALGDYNVPQPLTVFPKITQAGSLRQEVEGIMKQFGLGTLTPGAEPPSPDPGYLTNIDEETKVATQPTTSGNASFLSNKYFIEPNQE
tara:strand:- start:731 stop:2035 length:1305 start_codon:yes stop_codon:yes gene_type:complete